MVIIMSELSTEQREKLKDRDFAYIDKDGERHLPIHDEEHVRNAIARWSRTDFDRPSDKEAARKTILGAAKRFGIEVSPDDKIMHKAA
jgi:ribosomal protein L11